MSNKIKGKLKSKTEKMLYDIFRLCDKTVWLEDFPEFHESFNEILKQYGYNLWKIYFGVKTEEEWRKKCRKAAIKYFGKNEAEKMFAKAELAQSK